MAHETGFQSTVTVDTRPGPTQRSTTFFGEVRSPNEKCVNGRTVVLYTRDPNLIHQVGETKTDAEGDWEISAPEARLRGDQFVKVFKKTLVKTNRHRHVCKGDKTPAS